MADKDTITLISSDDECYEISKELVQMSQTIVELMNDLRESESRRVRLANVKGNILQRIIDYYEFHIEVAKRPPELARWTKEEIKEFEFEYMRIEQSTLYELIIAADYLKFKMLLDLCCQTIANMIRGKSVEEIRRTFGIKNDLTVEEEEESYANMWAYL